MSLNADSLIDAMDWDADNWRFQSACKDTDPEIFFPIGQTGMALDQIAYAKAICAGCPVQKQCLEYALTSNQEAGVWGGGTEEERRIIRRARRNAARINAQNSQAS